MRRRTTWAISALAALAALACGSRAHDAAATATTTDSLTVRGADTGADASRAWRVTPDRLLLDLVHDGDLDAAQEQQLLSIRADHERDWRVVHDASAAAVRAFDAELAKPSPDLARMHGAADQALAAHATLTRTVTDRVLALLAELSPAQRALLVDHHAAGLQRSVLKKDFMQLLNVGSQPGAPRTELPDGAARRVTIQPYELGLSLDREISPLQKQLRQDLHHEFRELRQELQGNLEGVLEEVSRPTPDQAVLRAFVERALAGYARITHASIATAFRLRSAAH